MVVTIIWIKPWVVIMISLCALFVITTMLFYCVCCKRKKDKSRFYILDENGFRTSSITEFAQNSLTNLRLYRRLSTNKETKNEHVFTSHNLPFCKISNDLISADSELLDSLDAVQSFENSTLQIVQDDSQSGTKDELYSCISSDSQYSFYSTHPIAKSNSRGTFVSVEFNCDTETLID